jgi:hypothetical protein
MSAPAPKRENLFLNLIFNIALPSAAILMVILWKLIGGIGTLTGLTTDEIFRSKEAKKA